METKFTQTILAYLDQELSRADFQEWYLAQKMLDQPEILREVKFIMDQRYDVDKKSNASSIHFAAEIDAFEDFILTHKLTKELISIQEDSLQTMRDKIKENLHNLRITTIYHYTNKIGDQKNLLVTAQELIETEKQFNVYDPENWKEMEGML
jgi:hypothetical protein